MDQITRDTKTAQGRQSGPKLKETRKANGYHWPMQKIANYIFLSDEIHPLTLKTFRKVTVILTIKKKMARI